MDNIYGKKLDAGVLVQSYHRYKHYLHTQKRKTLAKKVESRWNIICWIYSSREKIGKEKYAMSFVNKLVFFHCMHLFFCNRSSWFELAHDVVHVLLFDHVDSPMPYRDHMHIDSSAICLSSEDIPSPTITDDSNLVVNIYTFLLTYNTFSW
jgi:hypothetical protein